MSEGKTRLVLFAAALGLAVLYGGAATLILWLLESKFALEVGLITAGATAVLAFLVAGFATLFFAQKNDRSFCPLTLFERLTLVLAVTALFILLIPPTILSLGLIWRWILGGPKEAEAIETDRQQAP